MIILTKKNTLLNVKKWPLVKHIHENEIIRLLSKVHTSCSMHELSPDHNIKERTLVKLSRFQRSVLCGLFVLTLLQVNDTFWYSCINRESSQQFVFREGSIRKPCVGSLSTHVRLSWFLIGEINRQGLLHYLKLYTLSLLRCESLRDKWSVANCEVI